MLERYRNMRLYVVTEYICHVMVKHLYDSLFSVPRYRVSQRVTHYTVVI